MTLAGLVPERGPARLVVASLFVNSLGTGAYLAAGVLYFTRVTGFTPATVGMMLSVGGLLALAMSSPLGYLSDRMGTRGMAVGTCLLEATAMVGLILVRTPWQLAAVSAVALTGEQGSRTLRNVIIARIGGTRQVRLRAQARALANLGMAVGGALAGAALLVDAAPAYAGVLVANAASFLVAASLLVRLPRYPPVAMPRGGLRLPVLRDWRFALVVSLYGVLTLQVGVLAVVLPLWIITATGAPASLAAVAVVTNTVIVVGFQLRASAAVVDPVTAGRSMCFAGAAFLASAALFAGAAQKSVWTASSLLVVAVVTYTLGELWQAAAGFELAHGLAPAHAAGQYQGLFDLAVGIARAVAPGVLIPLCVNGGRAGWLTYGTVLFGAGLLAPLAVRSAVRRHQ